MTAIAFGTTMPFLYPSLVSCGRGRQSKRFLGSLLCLQQTQPVRNSLCAVTRRRCLQTSSRQCQPARLREEDLPPLPDVTGQRSLNPAPDDFASNLFEDQAEITIVAGSGGHGCISFLREKFIAAGPANGGDGGTGGNVYISAVAGIKSLHKVARRREVRAGNGRNGMGSSRGGQRGEDVVLEVPVGTVVQEISRWDPVAEAEREWEAEENEAANARYIAKKEEKKRRYAERIAKWEAQDAAVGRGVVVVVADASADGSSSPDDPTPHDSVTSRRQSPHSWADEEFEDYRHHYNSKQERAVAMADMKGFGADSEPVLDVNGDVVHKRPSFEADQRGKWRRDRWLLQPSSLPSEYATTDFPALPRPRRSNIAAGQPEAPITLDLSKPTLSPVLLAAGAMGGLGNPHFVTKTIHRPKYATKGNVGMRIKLRLELKLLADLGFVGMPNAGKSTLLRALSNSRARVGSWAFTTLVPNLGTVVLDDNRGRVKHRAHDGEGNRLTGITVADIPGLIEGASQDRGLGLDFLRHVERAKVLAFVVDLAAGDAVDTLKKLWRELAAYESMRGTKEAAVSGHRGVVDWGAIGTPLHRAGVGNPRPRSGDEAADWQEEGDERENQDEGISRIAHTPGDVLLQSSAAPIISEKAWFVVATKADLDGTQENFVRLQRYLSELSAGQTEHPAGRETSGRARWQTAQLRAVPVSAIHGHGIEGIVTCTTDLLAGRTVV